MPSSTRRYNLEEKAYKPEPQLEQVTLQYASEGCLVWRDGEEGHRVAEAKALVEEMESKPVCTFFGFCSTSRCLLHILP